MENGFRTAPARVRIISADRREAEIAIREGKKRQVKRMLQAVGNRVTYLKRTAIGPLDLGNLARGKWRRLTTEEVALFKGKTDTDSDPDSDSELSGS